MMLELSLGVNIYLDLIQQGFFGTSLRDFQSVGLRQIVERFRDKMFSTVL